MSHFQKSNCFLAAACCAALFLLPAPAVCGQLFVDPVTVEADAAVGQDFTGVIRVSMGPVASDSRSAALPGAGNKAEVPHINMRIADWDMSPSGALQYGPPGKWPGSCAPYLQLNPVEFDLKEGAEMDVRYTVRLPPDLPDGTYRAVIFSQTRPVAVPGKRAVSLSSAIGTIIYLTKGSHSRKARITGFSAGPAGAHLRILNLGPDHLRLSGTLKIEDAAGALVREFPLPAAVILPGADCYRDVDAPFPDDLKLAPGDYLVTAIVNYRGDTLLGVRKKLTVGAAH